MNIAKKEEYRYLFAGMAMHAILSAILQRPGMSEVTIIRSEAVVTAVDYADALIKELDRTDKR